MMNVPTWNIHTGDGKYLGQNASIHPKIALCRYLMTAGGAPSLEQITREDTDDGACSLNFNGDTFLVTLLG